MIDVQWPRANLKDFPELADDPNIKMDCWGDFVVTAYAASILRELHKISTKIDVPYVRDNKVWLKIIASTADGRSADAEAEVLRVPEWESRAMALQILQTRLLIEATLKVLRGHEPLPDGGEPIATGVIKATLPTQAILSTSNK